MDFNEFKKQLTLSTKQAFLEIYNQNPNEEIYSFALCNNDSKISIHPSSNSLEYFKEVSDDDDFYYYKYEPSEWKYEYKGAEELFNAINDNCKLIVEKHDDDEDWFYNFQQQINKKCIEVLEELKNDEFFKRETGKEIFLNFSVIDEDLNKEKQKTIIEKLNNNHYKDDYLNWMKSWDKRRKVL